MSNGTARSLSIFSVGVENGPVPKKKGHASTCPGRTTVVGRGSHGQQQDMEGWRGNLVHSILCQQHFILVVCETNREECVRVLCWPREREKKREGRTRSDLDDDGCSITLRWPSDLTWSDLNLIHLTMRCGHAVTPRHERGHHLIYTYSTKESNTMRADAAHMPA